MPITIATAGMAPCGSARRPAGDGLTGPRCFTLCAAQMTRLQSPFGPPATPRRCSTDEASPHERRALVPVLTRPALLGLRVVVLAGRMSLLATMGTGRAWVSLSALGL